MSYFNPENQNAALGMQIVSSGRGEAKISVPYRDDLIGDAESGVIAGGVVTTLLDATCGYAVNCALDDPTSIATLDLRIDYMRRAKPGLAIVAEAHVYRLTKNVAFVRAIAHDGDSADPVAAAQAAFMLDSNAGRKAGANLATTKEGGAA